MPQTFITFPTFWISLPWRLVDSTIRPEDVSGESRHGVLAVPRRSANTAVWSRVADYGRKIASSS